VLGCKFQNPSFPFGLEVILYEKVGENGDVGFLLPHSFEFHFCEMDLIYLTNLFKPNFLTKKNLKFTTNSFDSFDLLDSIKFPNAVPFIPSKNSVVFDLLLFKRDLFIS